MADRYAVLQKLGDGQNAMLGVAAGGIEAAATQPLTYAKNCFQQRTPLSLVPRVVYRGTPASMAADGTLIGTQFACCGFLCGNQIFNPTSMWSYATASTQALRLCFENSTRAIDSSKNQPNRLRFDRAREV